MYMKSLVKAATMVAVFGFISLQAKAQMYPEMVTVAGDTFKMGSESGHELGDANIVHKVILATFKIAKTEVTVKQWKEYCDATANPMPKDVPNGGWVDNNPIVNVSWEDAYGYCEWLSTETGKKYRLPTEAEWEYAARGGTTGKGYKFSGGKGMELVGWCADNSGGTTHPVATKRANELGLYDMSGNVYEWCSDRYGSYPGKMVLNPKGANAGAMRVYRGGSWFTPANYCAVGNRESNNPKEGFSFVGFRPVEEVETVGGVQPTYAAQPSGRK